MLIAKRTKDGWTPRQPNKSKTNCDDCGSKLWVDPGGNPYCDKASEKHHK